MFKWLKKKQTQQTQNKIKTADYSVDDLASEFLQALKNEFPNDIYVYDKDAKMIELSSDKSTNDSDKSGLKITLDNFYNKLKTENEETRQDYLIRFLTQFKDGTPDTPETFKAQLYYRVRTQEEMANRTLYMNGMGAENYKPLVTEIGDLRLEFVLDREDTLSVPTADDFETQSISPSEATKITQENMARVTTDMMWQSEDGFWISPFQDDYDGARVVSLHPKGKLPISGDPILFMPSHAVCLITDKVDAAVFLRMVEMGDRLAENHRPLSARFWTFGAGGWSPLRVATDHPAYQLIHHQSVLDNLSAYGEQKRCLDEKYEKDGIDIFVANYSALQNDKGDVLSYAVLSLGVDTLLPKTDNVVIFDPDAPKKKQASEMIEWDQFISIIGTKNLVEAEGHYPMRYDFIGRLKDADFAHIRKVIAEL